MNHLDVAAALVRAEKEQIPVGPFTRLLPDLDVRDAYDIQRINVARRIAAGRHVIGYTAGAVPIPGRGSPEHAEPGFGYLLDDMLVSSGSVEAARYLVPRAAVQIAFVLGEPLTGVAITMRDVLEATDHLRAAIEVTDSRIAGTRIGVPDAVADNAGSAAVVLGERRVPPRALDLATLKSRIRADDQDGEGSPACPCSATRSRRPSGSSTLSAVAACPSTLPDHLAGTAHQIGSGEVRTRIVADIDAIGRAEVLFT